MAHQRKRHSQDLLTKLLGFSPIVGVLGHRQVGKTTLITQLAKSYQTLDLQKNLSLAQLDPQNYIDQLTKHPAAIDEAQLCPELFPALKEKVRLNKQPGQFLLSGSVRFTSRKAIRESLTGRIINLELLPFTQSECDDRPINNLPIKLFKQDLRQTKPALKSKEIDQRHKHLLAYAHKGGLPGVCFTRDVGVRTEQIETNLQTILDRDLRLIHNTTLRYQTLRGLLSYLAIWQGQPISLADMSRKTRISLPTLKLLLQAFENLFLIRILPTLGGEKAPVIFFEDQAEASHLNDQRSDIYSDWLRILYANLRVPFTLQPDLKSVFFQYRTRGGSFVPLAVKTTQGTLGFAISLERNPSRSTLTSASIFLKKFDRSRVVILTPYADHEVMSGQILLTSFAEVM